MTAFVSVSENTNTPPPPRKGEKERGKKITPLSNLTKYDQVLLRISLHSSTAETDNASPGLTSCANEAESPRYLGAF